MFVVCYIIMLSEMETRETHYRVGRGAPAGRDAIWLRGPQPAPVLPRGDGSNRQLALEWGKRRKALAAHLKYSKRQRKRARRTITP